MRLSEDAVVSVCAALLLAVEGLVFKNVMHQAYEIKAHPIYLEKGRTPLDYYIWQDDGHRYLFRVVNNTGTLTFNCVFSYPPFRRVTVASITGNGLIRVPRPEQDQDMYVDSTGTAELMVR